MTVRVELSAAAVDRFRKGPDSLSRLIKGFQVGGAVARLSNDSLLLLVPLQFLDVDARLRTLNHDLLLFRQDMQRAQIRRLDKKRTTWLAVALGAATAASVAIVLNHGGRRSGGNDGPVDPPPEIRVPFSFRLPVP
jgi:hypothetical protein